MSVPHNNLAELVDSGMSDPEVAHYYRVDARTVLRWRKREGIESQYRPATLGHGTRACYRRGCRCQLCTKANTDWSSTQRKERSKNPEAHVRVHGAGAYRNHGCRCDICTRANSAESLRYYHARKNREAKP